MVDLQAAKDAFYLALRDRIAAGNAGRTVVVRGAVRPAVLVDENELVSGAKGGPAPLESFRLVWLGVRASEGGEPLALRCEVRYASEGTDGAVGMDRGRALAAMDAELLMALGVAPRAAGVFWSVPVLGAAAMNGERLTRAAEVEVFCDGN